MKYLNLLIDCPIDEAIIVSKCNKTDIALAAKIADSSRKYVWDGRLDIILNKIQKDKMNCAIELLNNFELNLLGYLEKYENPECEEMINILEIIYSRMNLPQIES